ncbi:molybdopterin-dependent oxidoreductase [Flexivirga sp. ID2601S]|uniref:Molybdopterin-dependent oxidoreductase n=1 Tax=Flexivirga aerilata TaxID=1656889 RepID=A0A849AIH0_9MICO|nr:molybdopterin-dependent oxidoreductase [Flexivirga aerilata]NNG39121.1 molybdopterin-dependent oxidoreductase [Flexivirga aerilata]
MTDERLSRIRAALIGLLSVGVGLAAGQLVGALRNPATSPVLAVGSAVIDRTPTSLKDWAIRTFGSNDKPVLLASVVVAVLVVAAASGLLARSRPWLGAAVQVAMLVVAGYAVLTRPFAAASDLVPTVCAGAVSIAALFVLLRLAAPSPGPQGASRRTFVAAAGGTAALAALGVASGRAITDSRSAIDVKLPAADPAAPALPAGLDETVPGVTPLRTPNSSFYRVDTELSVPNLSASDWKLTIDGDVENPYTISFSELLRRPLTERNITITCVSNEVGGKYAGGATWRGVLLKDLLAEARVKNPDRPDLQVLSTSFNGFTISTPLGAMTDDRGAMLAIGMNGAPLPREHGFPARLITPGLYGMLGCTKWVTRLTVTTYADRKAYWTKRGWTTDGEIKPTARIDVPAGLATVKPGRVLIGGTAWAQRRGVVGVQVSIDGGPWTAATLGPDVNVDYWRQWYYAWQSSWPGQHSVRARVVYGDNEIQTSARAGVFPSGSSGIEERVFLVG